MHWTLTIVESSQIIRQDLFGIMLDPSDFYSFHTDSGVIKDKYTTYLMK